MKRHSLISKFLILAAVLAFCAPLTFADTPGQHPGYLHVLADLRYARSLLRADIPPEANAIGEIDRAISEVKKAAVDDGKAVQQPTPTDPNAPRRGRLMKAKEALESANHRLRAEEDNPSANVWRDRTAVHITEALHIVNQEINQLTGR